MMLKGLGDIGQIMKLQKEFKNIQKKLQKTESEGASADGSVRVKVNGEYKVTDMRVDEALLKGGDAKKLEKMVMQAVNAAVDRSKETAAEEMQKLTGGLNIPGLGNFLK
jgi:nucleoid-associated protein EbfC